MDSLDVLFAFELSIAIQLEGQNVSYNTTIEIGEHTYHITYLVYASP
jgi:hypothetical protein